MRVAIHQPNFIPWLGFFHKLVCSDIFVLFDDVQFPRAKSYANRALIKTQNGKLLLTVPVLSRGDLLTYRDIEIDNKTSWAKKMLKTIELSYKKAPSFSLVFPGIEKILSCNHTHLLDLNSALIRFACDIIASTCRIQFSSELCPDKNLSGEHKIHHILKTLNATDYISGEGEGSKRYIQKEHFDDLGIRLEWQNFLHPTYPQLHGAFSPNLSIIDLLFNCGKDGLNFLKGASEIVQDKYNFITLTRTNLDQNLSQMLEILKDDPREYWDASSFQKDLSGKWDFSRALFDEASHKVLGYIVASRKIDSVHIHKFMIHPDFRGKGLGSLLYRDFEIHCRKKNITSLSLKVFKDAENAQRFYKKNGFSHDISDTDTYHVMRKPL